MRTTTKLPMSRFPYFGNREHDHFEGTDHPNVLVRKVPPKTVKLEGRRGACRDGLRLCSSPITASIVAWAAKNVAPSFDENVPYTPAWAEKVTGVYRRIRSSQSLGNLPSTRRRPTASSMVILGAGLNHWYHMDMNYRGIINHVDHVRLHRPVRRWLELIMSARKNYARKRAGCRWHLASTGTGPPRQMNSTSFFYAHTDQWRYETLKASMKSCRQPRQMVDVGRDA